MISREPTLSSILEHMESPTSRSENMLYLRPINPEMFSQLQNEADIITQLYLNRHDESYRLRLERATQPNGDTSHKAILESIEGRVSKTDQLRSYETEISQEAFDFYLRQPTYPHLEKQRYQVGPGVTIDWINENDSLLKIDVTAHVPTAIDLSPDRYEYSDTPLFDDEFRARQSTGNDELFTYQQELQADKIAAEIARHQLDRNPYTFVTIAGRSGSGKSTIREKIKQELAFLLPNASIAELSTDDYHRGLTRLTEYNLVANGSKKPWDDWDTRIVYDVDLARIEIAELMKHGRGTPIPKRAYDFGKQEPVKSTEYIEPAQIIILDGLYAGDIVFGDIAHLRYEVPTGIATSIWRRLDRDFKTGRATGDNVNSPEKILKYMIERAEPAYQAQNR